MSTHIDYSHMTRTFLAWCDTCGDKATNIQGTAEALAWTQNHSCTHEPEEAPA